MQLGIAQPNWAGNPVNPVSNAIVSGTIPRRIARDIHSRLGLFPAVALLGPRQIGTTTLARFIADSRESVYLDLENPHHTRKLADPLRHLSTREKRLVVLDEVQRMPGLFEILRGIIDEGRRRGSGLGRFLMSGSASAACLSQSGGEPRRSDGPFGVAPVRRIGTGFCRSDATLGARGLSSQSPPSS